MDSKAQPQVGPYRDVSGFSVWAYCVALIRSSAHWTEWTSFLRVSFKNPWKKKRSLFSNVLFLNLLIKKKKTLKQLFFFKVFQCIFKLWIHTSPSTIEKNFLTNSGNVDWASLGDWATMREGKVGCETLAWPNLSGWARPTGFASFCTLNGARVKYLYR